MIRRRTRGFSLIETMITIGILMVGVLGIAQMQIIGVRSKNFATNISTASLLAHDLAEQAARWSYTDTRLTTLSTVTSTTDSAVTALWDMGRLDTVPTAKKAQFAEQVSDSNATTASALGTYQGASPPLIACTLTSECPSGTTCQTNLCKRSDGTGPSQFYRYWNVFGVDLTNSGTAQGKLVQVIVRWKEPGFGMRQVAFSTYVSDPTAVWQ